MVGHTVVQNLLSQENHIDHRQVGCPQAGGIPCIFIDAYQEINAQCRAYEEKIACLQEEIDSERRRADAAEEQNAELQAKLGQAEALVRLHQKTLFDASSEKRSSQSDDEESDTAQQESASGSMPEVADAAQGDASEQPDETDDQQNEKVRPFNSAPRRPKRKRGGQPGHPGHGRKIPVHLNVRQEHRSLPDEQKRCGECGKEYRQGPPKVSYRLTIVFNMESIEEVREQVIPDCNCGGKNKPFVAAPRSPQAIPKGKFSHDLMAVILVLRFFIGLPIERVLDWLNMHGCGLSKGTVFGVLKQLMPLLNPLYQAMLEHCKEQHLWAADETTWGGFTEGQGKRRDWFWIFKCREVILYIFDHSRSSSVLYRHLDGKTGILLCDRYSAYKKLARLITGITLAFCWAHFRRDFIRAGTKHPELKSWADYWVDQIGKIFAINRRRLAASTQEEWEAIQNELEQAIEDMKAKIEEQAKDPNLHPEQKKVLKSAIKHWEGLTVFVDVPIVPMDNNSSEQGLRKIALMRKNSYGSHSEWGAELMAICTTILATAHLHGLNPQAYLIYYLDACGQAGGAPKNIEDYLPWNIPQEIREAHNLDIFKKKSA